MDLETFKYADLFGNEMNVHILEYGDRKVVVDMLRKLHKGEYTLILCVPYGDKEYDVIKGFSRLIVEELEFSGLVIQSDRDGAIQLIAYFQLEEWQKIKIYNLLAPAFGLDLKELS